ncbi:MAG: HAD family hydrolase [Trueperaceae bacterium]
MATVSFDLDGVLIQNPFALGVFPRMRAHIRQNPLLRSHEAEDADELIDQAVREEWVARMVAGDFVAAYDWDSILAKVSRDFGGDGVPDVASLVEQCCGEEGMIALLPGARECLEELREGGLKLVAATNGYRAYQWPVLSALGIAELFEQVLSPESAGFAKPSPEYFAGVPDLIAHVGDTLEHDVLGANLAGLTSVWFAPRLAPSLRRLEPRERTAHSEFGPYLEAVLEGALYREYHPAPAEAFVPDFVASDLREIPGLLARFFRAGY